MASYEGYPYSEEACLNDCFVHFFFDACCDFNERDSNEDSSCSVAEMLSCYATQKNDFYMGRSNCSCAPLCQRKHYSMHITSSQFGHNLISDVARLRRWPVTERDELRERYIEIQFYFSTLTYTERHQIPAATPWDLFSSAGGILGLFLGASVLSLLEFCDFFCTSVSKKCCNGNKLRSARVSDDVTQNNNDMRLQEVQLN